MKYTFLAVIASCFIGGCGDDKPLTITNITRVFMQNEGKYILYVQNPENFNEVKTVTINAGSQKIRVVTDVQAGQKAWFEGTESSSLGDPREYGTLHIRDLKQIEGAEDEQHLGRGRVVRHQNAPVE